MKAWISKFRGRNYCLQSGIHGLVGLINHCVGVSVNDDHALQYQGQSLGPDCYSKMGFLSGLPQTLTGLKDFQNIAATDPIRPVLRKQDGEAQDFAECVL